MIISCKNYIISSDEWAKLKGLFTYYVTRFNGFRPLHACSCSFNTESPNHSGKGISPEKNFTPTRSRHNSVRGRFYSYRQYIGSQPRTWYKSIRYPSACLEVRGDSSYATLSVFEQSRRQRTEISSYGTFSVSMIPHIQNRWKLSTRKSQLKLFLADFVAQPSSLLVLAVRAGCKSLGLLVPDAFIAMHSVLFTVELFQRNIPHVENAVDVNLATN